MGCEQAAQDRDPWLVLVVFVGQAEGLGWEALGSIDLAGLEEGCVEAGSRRGFAEGIDFCSVVGWVASCTLVVPAANLVACDLAGQLVRLEGQHDSHHVMVLVAGTKAGFQL